MATRVYLMIPTEMKLGGMKWPAGPREVRDEAWARSLRAAGATVITEDEYLVATAQAGDAEVKKRRTKKPAKASAPAVR